MTEEHDEQGFTLIELLIVIIVLGILAAIVVLAVGNTRNEAVASACRTGYKAVELSVEAVHVKTDAYVVSGGGITSATPTASNPILEGHPLDNGALLKDWPHSDRYDIRYTSATGDTFTLQVLDAAGNPVQAGSPLADVPGVAGCGLL